MYLHCLYIKNKVYYIYQSLKSLLFSGTSFPGTSFSCSGTAPAMAPAIIQIVGNLPFFFLFPTVISP